jgi:hypothetical protein
MAGSILWKLGKQIAYPSRRPNLAFPFPGGREPSSSRAPRCVNNRGIAERCDRIPELQRMDRIFCIRGIYG